MIEVPITGPIRVPTRVPIRVPFGVPIKVLDDYGSDMFRPVFCN